MSAAWNLPDGCRPDDIPGDNRRDYAGDVVRQMLTPAATWQVRGELLAECRTGKAIHAVHIDYNADHGDITCSEFVALCERINAEVWQAKLDSVLRDLCSDPDGY